MFRIISKKSFDYMSNENLELTRKNNELIKENEKFQRLLDIVNEDNQILRNINEFHLKKYNDAKNIIRTLNNENPKNNIIPSKCDVCCEVLNYNENLHIAVCPECNKTFK